MRILRDVSIKSRNVIYCCLKHFTEFEIQHQILIKVKLIAELPREFPKYLSKNVYLALG